MSEDEWVDAFEGASVADLAWYREQSQNGAGQPQEDSWTPRNLAELEDKPPVQPTLGDVGLVYPGKRHVFSGPQESAKTLAAYVIGLSVVRSGSAVVLIDFEMGPWDAKTRLRELGASDADLSAFAYVAPEAPATQSAVERLVLGEPDLVLIDAAAGAYDLQELDDNKRGDVERFTRLYVNGFWKAGIATIVLDHVTKSAETRGNYAIGSERKVGGADVHLGFSVITPIRRGSHGRYQVTTHKDRGGCLKRGKLATFELASDPETHHFSWAFVPAQEADEEHPFRPTHLMEKVSRYVEIQSERVSVGDIKNNVTGKDTYVLEAVKFLVDEGYLEETLGPRSARLFESLIAYREAVDNPLIPPIPDPFPTHAPEGTGDPFPVPHPLRGERDGTGDLEDGNGSQRSLDDDDDGIPF